MATHGRHSNSKDGFRANWKGLCLFLCVCVLISIALVVLFTSGKLDAGSLAASETEPEVSAQTEEATQLAETEASPAEPEPEPEPEPPAPTTAAVSLRCAGDIMAHKAQMECTYVAETESWDFSRWFMYVQPYFDNCDLLMANIETPFKGSGPYNGYPAFNSPDELLYQLVDCGIDVALLSNNHMLDTGLDGLLRGLDMFREAGVLTVGAQYPDEDKFIITEVNGVNIGVVAYTYETQKYQGMRTINGYAVSQEKEPYIDSFGYQDGFDADMQTIIEQMRLCREAGADVIVLYMHWGEEYQLSANPWQTKMAKLMAENGADIIIGSHPHTIQEIVTLEAQQADGSIKEVPCFYSIGNFISNQRAETLGNSVPNGRYTADGMLACVDFTYSFEEEKIIDFNIGCIPTWVEKYKDSTGLLQYYVLPLTEGYEDSEILAESGHLSQAQQALADIIQNIGSEEYIWQE